MWIGAFYALLLNGQRWVPAIIDSFNQIGANAAGVGTTLSPGDVFSQGLSISAALMDAASNSGFFDHPGTSLAMTFAALLIVISYIIITINFIVTVVESYLVVSVGFIFLGFGGSRWTAPYVERYIGLAVAIGIKILLLYCLISTGLNLGTGWLTEAQGIGTAPHPNMTAFDVMGAALIFMMLCWQIPKVFAAVLGGAPALTGGDLVGTGVAVATGALAAGAVATGAVAAAGGGVSALTGTSSAVGSRMGGSGLGGAVASVGSAGPGGGGTGSSDHVPPPQTAARRDVSATGAGAAQSQPGPPSSPSQGSAARSDPGPVSSGRSSPPAGRVKTVFGGLSDQFRSAKERLGPLPSDSAPHVSPPRMPIDQHE
jgi:type IV secretion system protein TrbL